VRALCEAGRNVSQIAREVMLPYSSAHKPVRIAALARRRTQLSLGKERCLFLFGTNHLLDQRLKSRISTERIEQRINFNPGDG